MTEASVDTGNFWTNLILIGTGIAGGGLAVALIEWLRDYMMKKREERVDMLTRQREEYVAISQEKIKFLNDLVPFYVQLTSYHNSNAILLNAKLNAPLTVLDTTRCLFYISRILALDDQLLNKGGYQLHDLTAEEIVYRCGYFIFSRLSRDLEYRDIHILRSLTEDNCDYQVFSDKFEYNQNLEVYRIWLNGLDNNSLREIEKNSRWFSQILTFELNHIYSIFYGREPSYNDELDPDLQNYLQNNYADYHNKIRDRTQ